MWVSVIPISSHESVGDDFLARTNPHSDIPALEHAYAVTTYSAQDTTVDRAFVMADPSMDKPETRISPPAYVKKDAGGEAERGSEAT